MTGFVALVLLPRAHRPRGLAEVLTVQRFKFAGRVVTPGDDERLVREFLGSPAFAAGVGLGSALGPESVEALAVKAMPASVLNMGFFDGLETEGLIAPNCYLRKCMNDRVGGVEIDTLVGDLLLNEDSEHAGVLTAAQKAEFIYGLFRVLFIGGAMHQRDEDVIAYLEQTKFLYKELLSVHKKAATGKVEITSRVFEAGPSAAQQATGRGGALFPGGVVEHCKCFVVVDPVKKYVTAVHVNFKSFW